MKVKAVIWDMGGVLVRTEDYLPRTALARQFGLSCRELEDVVFENPSARLATAGAIRSEEHWLNVASELHLEPERIGWFQSEFFAGDRLDERCVSFIRGLRPRLKTGLLSNAFSDVRHVTDSLYHYLDAFDVAIFSAEVGLAKPDPRIYALMLERLGVQAGEAVFIDDFIANITGAQSVGLRTIHFHSADQALAELDSALLEDGRA